MVCSAASATLVFPNYTLLSAKASCSTTSFSRSQTLSIPKSFHVLPNFFQHSISTRPISLARDACRSHSRRSFAVKSAKSLLSVTYMKSFNNLTLKYWESRSIVRNLAVPHGCSNSCRISREPKLPIEKEKSMRVFVCTKVARLELREKRKFLPLASAAEDFPARETLDLTEDHVKQVLADARVELGQIFDTSVGMTGEVDLAELDGPFVTIRLKGRFWHKRSTVVARVGNYLKQRIPEILEVDIENEKQLDDSPENF